MSTLSPAEQKVCALPSLISWLSAEDLVDGSGNYPDHGPGGNNGLQATVGLQPAIYTNPTTARKAWIFDGVSGQYILMNFNIPVSPLTFAVVCDMDPAVGVGSYTAIGSFQDNTATRWALRHSNKLMQLFNVGGGNGPSSTQSTGTPLLLVGCFDPTNQQMGLRINGGSWIMSTGVVQTKYGSRDVTGIIGAYRSDLGQQWLGHIYEVLSFADAFSDSSNATELALVEATLKAKHGIA